MGEEAWLALRPLSLLPLWLLAPSSLPWSASRSTYGTTKLESARRVMLAHPSRSTRYMGGSLCGMCDMYVRITVN